MAIYKDSLGNVYSALPKAPPQHTAKSSKSAFVPRRSSLRKLRKGNDKYTRYRARVGKPLGKGVKGNKAGRNKVLHKSQHRDTMYV